MEKGQVKKVYVLGITSIVLDFSPGLFFFINGGSPDFWKWWALHLSYMLQACGYICGFLAALLLIRKFTSDRMVFAVPIAHIAFKAVELVKLLIDACFKLAGYETGFSERITVFELIPLALIFAGLFHLFPPVKRIGFRVKKDF